MFRALAVLAALALAAPAQAATVTLVADPALVTPVQTVNPGSYGVEVRGGRRGNADWELGVGTQTSRNNSTFANGQVTWPAPPALLDYRLSWTSGRVEMTIGTTTLGWDAAWKVGNAVTVSLKAGSGDTVFTIATLDGAALDWSKTITNGPTRNFTFWGKGLTDGWVMTGKIGMTPEGGSNRGVQITAATYAAPVPVPAALPLLAFGLGALLLAGRRRRRV
jgi:hypothetical protein